MLVFVAFICITTAWICQNMKGCEGSRRKDERSKLLSLKLSILCATFYFILYFSWADQFKKSPGSYWQTAPQTLGWSWLTFLTVFFVQAKLTPSDDIVVYYQASSELDAVVKQFSEYITSTTKQPLQPYPVKRGESVIISESLPVSNFDLFIQWTISGWNCDNVKEKFCGETRD